MADMNEKINAALETLKRKGHKVGSTAATGPDGLVRFAIDDRLLTYDEIYTLAAESQKAKPE